MPIATCDQQLAIFNGPSLPSLFLKASCVHLPKRGRRTHPGSLIHQVRKLSLLSDRRRVRSACARNSAGIHASMLPVSTDSCQSVPSVPSVPSVQIFKKIGRKWPTSRNYFCRTAGLPGLHPSVSLLLYAYDATFSRIRSSHRVAILSFRVVHCAGRNGELACV